MAYLDKDAFALRTSMPPEHVDDIEDRTPGWIDMQLESWSRWVDMRLGKRYAVPFAAPAPEIVLSWVTWIVTLECYKKRGVDPNDLEMELYRSDHSRAFEEVREAAEAQFGLFALPLSADTSASGIKKGYPRTYSEASPYVWTDEQARVARAEDRNRGGTFHG